MKLPCEMVQDLLPLYHDGVCSEVSKTLVEEHLTDCEGCAQMLKNIDAEIEVPKNEVDAAKPLAAIQITWNKQKRKTLLKCLGAGVAAFLLFVAGWWGTTQWCIVPMTGRDYRILECSRLSNGCVYVGITWNYTGNNYPERIDTDDGHVYHYRLRTLLAGKSAENAPQEEWYFDPEQDYVVNSSGERIELKKIYLGTPEDSILVWEDGMELPPASERVEAEYKQLQEAFAAPNAPEEPDVISVVNLPETGAEEVSRNGDAVQETVVSGTEPAE